MYRLPIYSLKRTALSQCCSCAETSLCLSPDSVKHNQSVSRSVGSLKLWPVGWKASVYLRLTMRWPLIVSSRSSSLEPSQKSWNRSTTIHAGLLCHNDTHISFILRSRLILENTQRAHTFTNSTEFTVL